MSNGGFDIQLQKDAAKETDKGIVVHINGIDEKPLFYNDDRPVTITVAGAHSTRVRRCEERLRKRKLKPRAFTSELIYEDGIEKAAAATITWEGFHVNGDPVDPTPENIKMVYKACPWVYDQVLEAMNDTASFFENSSTQP